MSRNVGLVTISTDELIDAQRMEEMAAAEFPILADTDANVAQSYGVFNLLNDGVAAPATFIIRPDGGVIWAYIGADIGDRPPTDALLEIIDALLELEGVEANA